MEPLMHVVVRQYKGSSKLIDELEQRKGDVEKLIRDVPGFVNYYLVRTADGGVSISVFDSPAGTAESNKAAAAYIKENLDGIAAGPPEVVDGESVINFSA
jgi:heme-degrading monooxygenase HmoA